jgi:hypothetical protein
VSVRLITLNGRLLPREIQTFAFAFYRGGMVAFRNGVEVTPGEAMMCLAECVSQTTDDEVRAAEAISQPGALL